MDVGQGRAHREIHCVAGAGRGTVEEAADRGRDRRRGRRAAGRGKAAAKEREDRRATSSPLIRLASAHRRPF